MPTPQFASSDDPSDGLIRVITAMPLMASADGLHVWETPVNRLHANPTMRSPPGNPLRMAVSHQSDPLGKRSHAVSDLQEGALMAAYRMFPPVGPDRADELAAGDTSVGFGPACGTPRSQAIGVLTMGIGCIGAPDGDATQRSVPASPPCSNARAGAVPTAGCSSNMMTSWRLTTSAGIDETPAITISKSYMDTAMMRRPGNMGSTSRSVCVTSIRTLRSGVHGNGHAPFWSSGRRSDPPIDCNKRSALRHF
jgi:hypothetical protein